MKKLALLLTFCCFLQISLFAQSDVTKIRKHIQYLASDELAGRLPETDGETKAADYICQSLKSSGCKLLYNNGFQKFTVNLKSMNGDKTLHAVNVAAMVKGSKNPDEYIVVGAHFDHLGMGGFGSGSRQPDTVAVHNGADDNASGVSALLECARIMAKQKPERSILFVAFSAEEKGLLGSKYFVEHLPFKKGEIKAMLNFDMVGRLDSVLSIEGTKTATQFDSLLTLVDKKEFGRIQRSPGGFGPSDQTSFYAEKIPVLFFHTSIHPQYHTPFDDFELINNQGVVQIVDFAVRFLQQISKSGQAITYQSTGNAIDMSRGSLKVSLGIMPDHASGGDGLRIAAISPGKAAERAGLQKGDIITAIQGEKVDGIESYMNQMNKCEKGQIILIDILRNGEKKILTVAL